MIRLILIRHGGTDYNLQNRYCGFSNPSLNNKGIRQSERLGAKLKDIEIDKVYSSDLKRAYETAKIIFKNNSIEKTADFREMNFGLFERLKYEEIAKIYPKLYKSWIDNTEKVRLPYGEGLTDLSKRVNQKLSFIFSQSEGKTIALVTHGGPIRVMLYKALRFDLKAFWQIEQEIGALNIIDYTRKSSPCLRRGLDYQARVVKMNDISHLYTKEGDAL